MKHPRACSNHRSLETAHAFGSAHVRTEGYGVNVGIGAKHGLCSALADSSDARGRGNALHTQNLLQRLIMIKQGSNGNDHRPHHSINSLHDCRNDQLFLTDEHRLPRKHFLSDFIHASISEFPSWLTRRQ